GYEWVVFTATVQVRNNFAKFGIPLTYLDNADKARLGEAQNAWGSYYEQAPQIMAANTAEAAHLIHQAIAANRLFPAAQQIWSEALLAGQRGRLSLPPCVIEASLVSQLNELQL
ncbi:MAG: hypothetical protein FD130_2394, partial [Halothiobacillaceae bacterium]